MSQISLEEGGRVPAGIQRNNTGVEVVPAQIVIRAFVKCCCLSAAVCSRQGSGCLPHPRLWLLARYAHRRTLFDHGPCDVMPRSSCQVLSL